MEKRMYGAVYDPQAILKDRWRSFLNKTHVTEQEGVKAVKYIMKKHKIDEMEALKKLINAYFDKKMSLVSIKVPSRSSAAIVNTIINLKDL